MAHRILEDMWYLLDMFHGLGYSILFVLGLVWLRLLLQVVEDALAPQRKGMHPFVHPLSNPSSSGPEEMRRCKPQPSEVLPESVSTERRDLCA
jgi:hypothetical protein